MQIRLRKLSNARHALELIGPGARRERIECETRSFLRHDLLHYALERDAGLECGVWGRLAGGLSLAELNDRGDAPGPPPALQGELGAVEQAVGALQGALGGIAAAQWF